MSSVYIAQAEVTERIERLELAVRDVRRKIDHAHNADDRRALNRQLREMLDEIVVLRARLP